MLLTKFDMDFIKYKYPFIFQYFGAFPRFLFFIEIITSKALKPLFRMEHALHTPPQATITFNCTFLNNKQYNKTSRKCCFVDTKIDYFFNTMTKMLLTLSIKYHTLNMKACV